MTKCRLKSYGGTFGIVKDILHATPYWGYSVNWKTTEVAFILQACEACQEGSVVKLYNEEYELTVITHSSNVIEVKAEQIHTIEIDGKEIKISEESYKELKKSLSVGEEDE